MSITNDTVSGAAAFSGGSDSGSAAGTLLTVRPQPGNATAAPTGDARQASSSCWGLQVNASVLKEFQSDPGIYYTGRISGFDMNQDTGVVELGNTGIKTTVSQPYATRLRRRVPTGA